MKCLTYIVARDYGFAPNPFNSFCTLATCKPTIRSAAKVGDWILGVGSSKMKMQRKLIFAMEVNEKLTYNEYWTDQRFQCKKPLMNRSKKRAYGDNIYYYNEITKEWYQADSHHSNLDGSTNLYNLKRDTKSNKVLISNNFYYFGKNCPNLPDELSDKVCNGRGFKYIADSCDIEKIVKWLKSNFISNYIYEMPIQFDSTTFKRYDGLS